MSHQRPDQPAGPPPTESVYSDSTRRLLTQQIGECPSELRRVVEGLQDGQLDTLYKNWSIRQIIHHLADSHAHSYIRFKWAMTEDNPVIKAYEEADWVALQDCTQGAIEPPLSMLDGLHAKWVQTLESMSKDQFARTFRHPQSGETVSLWSALHYYPWHAKHHTGQILWLRENAL